MKPDYMMHMKPSFKYLVAVISLFLLLSFLNMGPANASGVIYDYIKDRYGRNLGLIYRVNDQQKSGELAWHKEHKSLLFIACLSREVLSDENKMRRTERNCSGDFAFWPDELLKHVVIALSKPVVLTGPPSDCGPCMPKPYVEFEMPPGVSVDRGILQTMQSDSYINPISPPKLTIPAGKPGAGSIYLPGVPRSSYMKIIRRYPSADFSLEPGARVDGPIGGGGRFNAGRGTMGGFGRGAAGGF